MDVYHFSDVIKVEDATLTLFSLIASHIDTSGNAVLVLFMNVLSAYNTLYKHMFKTLLTLEVNPDFILWIRQFLCKRLQRVRLNDPLCRDPVLSDEIVVIPELHKDASFLQFYFQFIRMIYRVTVYFLLWSHIYIYICR